MHKCLWPGCNELIPTDRWGCRPHWYSLPHNIRSWIGRAYREGQNAGTHPNKSWIEANRRAQAWALDKDKVTADEPEHDAPADR